LYISEQLPVSDQIFRDWLQPPRADAQASTSTGTHDHAVAWRGTSLREKHVATIEIGAAFRTIPISSWPSEAPTLFEIHHRR